MHKVVFVDYSRSPEIQIFHKFLLNLVNINAKVVEVCNDAQVRVKNIFCPKDTYTQEIFLASYYTVF